MKNFVKTVEGLNEQTEKTVAGYEKTSKELLAKYQAADKEYQAAYKEFMDARRFKKPESVLSELETAAHQKEDAVRSLGSELRIVESYLREDLLEVAGDISAVHDQFKDELLTAAEQLEKEVIAAKNRYLIALSKSNTEYRRIQAAEAGQVGLFQKLGLNTAPVLSSSLKPFFNGVLKVEQGEVIQASNVEYIQASIQDHNEGKEKRGIKSWLKNQVTKLKNCFKRLNK
ncbi:hypothetical protein [Peribacillus sp. TH24]|uniref:hypothetical protein n=1 Tax=Peribacillus sp. TH24 TaxID=2798483 RepID=UPI001912C231|nr:hypothetical protein [Peribacillus sp. TH24]MBK5444173.1 hypothetical protein [Peribacillus sp. TH24]